MILMVRSDSPGGDAPGGRLSFGSDLGSERQNVMCFEGVPFHDLRSDVSSRHLTDKGVGSKRSNSDFTHAGHDGFDKSNPLKIYRGESGGEHSRRPNNDEIFYGSKALRPSSLSQALLQHQTRSNTDDYSTKWDRAVAVNAPGNVQYPSYISPAHQGHSVSFRDATAGPRVISHVAADEESRSGKNGSGVWNLMKSSTTSDKSIPKSGHFSELSGAFVAGMKLKAGAHRPEQEAPAPRRTESSSSSRQMTSSSRQMTIFYDGHAYVFDDVHPYKAEVIMAMAGSNAVPCSSTVSPKSSMRQVKEGSTPTGKIEIGTASNTDLARNQRGQPPTAVTSIHEFRSSDQIPTLAGADQDSKGIR